MNRYVFFDVDETLIKIKSMFSFYKYYLEKTSRSEILSGNQRYNFFIYQLEHLANTRDREYVNRFYYKQYKGVNSSFLKDIGYKWAEETLCDTLFNPSVLCKFHKHKIDGLKTVLVSGSMSYCLEPLKKYLGADYSIWTNLEVHQSILTGEIIGKPNIGVGKKDNILNFLQKVGGDADLKNSFAYGDHESDIPMLSLVGNAYLVLDGMLVRFNLNNSIN